MTKQTQINTDILYAMKHKEDVALRVLRQLKSAFTNAALQKGNASDPLSDSDVIIIIRKQIAQREDSVVQFTKGGRMDLILSEQAEISILKQYLPEELTENQVDMLVLQAIEETGAVTKKDMGRAIKRAVELAAGRIDNKTLSAKIGSSLA